VIHGIKLSRHGFTIVEVIMFLAISGLMISGLLIAVSGGINNERYRDATNSFTDFLKEQYNLVDNVQNARVNADGGNPDGCNGERATTDCTIIGRYIASDDKGEKLMSWPIIAKNDVVEVIADSEPGDDDMDIYGAMNLEAPTGIGEMNREYALRWQTRLVAPVSKQDTSSAPSQPFRMVLLRSPLTSTISTYYAGGFVGGTDVMSVIGTTFSEKVFLCVDPRGLAPDKTGVSINPSGVNSSAIEFATATECRS